MTRIYLASSWRNASQPEAVFRLRGAGHEVYDFRNPQTPWTSDDLGDSSGGFSWADIDPEWEMWSPWSFRQALTTETAGVGFANDWGAMDACEVGVLLLPCGRSAHLEAGYFAGTPGKRLFIVAPVIDEPELMYLMADRIFGSIEELLQSGVLDEDSSSWAMAQPARAPRVSCSEHPRGAVEGCGPCWTAARAHSEWLSRERTAAASRRRVAWNQDHSAAASPVVEPVLVGDGLSPGIDDPDESVAELGDGQSEGRETRGSVGEFAPRDSSGVGGLEGVPLSVHERGDVAGRVVGRDGHIDVSGPIEDASSQAPDQTTGGAA